MCKERVKMKFLLENKNLKMTPIKDVKYYELLGNYPRRKLEKIECYGNSKEEAITELNNELKRRGFPECIRRNNGTYTVGVVEIILRGIFKIKIEQRTNIVLYGKRNDKHVVAVFLPTLIFSKKFRY